LAPRDGSATDPSSVSFLDGARIRDATALEEEAQLDVATDEELIERYRAGDARAAEALLSRYRGFARMKARSYFLAGAEREDVHQESMIGLYKAIRDFQAARQTSFRAFADVCMTRQLITAIRSARCRKHQPLNSYVSLSKPIESEESSERALMDVLAGPPSLDPVEVVIATEDLGDIKAAFDQLLSDFEIEVLRLHAEGTSYQDMAGALGRDVKSIDNALQRIKRKIEIYLQTRDADGAADPPAIRPSKPRAMGAAERSRRVVSA
jgi:RNA polymerase sporulation-specific sigma factor